MKHLSSEALIDVALDSLAGGELASHPHLAECSECRERLAVLENARKQAIPAVPEMTPGFWHTQRASVVARAQSGPSMIRWMPAAAAACLLLAVGLVWKPAPKIAEPSDAEVVAGVFAIADMEGPSAAAPLQALFDAEN